MFRSGRAQLILGLLAVATVGIVLGALSDQMWLVGAGGGLAMAALVAARISREISSVRRSAHASPQPALEPDRFGEPDDDARGFPAVRPVPELNQALERLGLEPPRPVAGGSFNFKARLVDQSVTHESALELAAALQRQGVVVMPVGETVMYHQTGHGRAEPFGFSAWEFKVAAVAEDTDQLWVEENRVLHLVRTEGSGEARHHSWHAEISVPNLNNTSSGRSSEERPGVSSPPQPPLVGTSQWEPLPVGRRIWQLRHAASGGCQLRTPAGSSHMMALSPAQVVELLPQIIAWIDVQLGVSDKQTADDRAKMVDDIALRCGHLFGANLDAAPLVLANLRQCARRTVRAHLERALQEPGCITAGADILGIDEAEYQSLCSSDDRQDDR